MKPNFSNWHTKYEKPEIKRQVIFNCDHDHHFLLGAIMKEDGFMDTSYGTCYWDKFIDQCDLRYWYYIDEIGQ